MENINTKFFGPGVLTGAVYETVLSYIPRRGDRLALKNPDGKVEDDNYILVRGVVDYVDVQNLEDQETKQTTINEVLIHII